MGALPYNVLDVNEWPVTALFAEEEINVLDGTPLKEIADFNPEGINLDEIQSDMVYRYIDLTCISSDVGLITKFKNIKGEELPARAKLRVREGDILLSTVRPERNLIAPVTKDFDGCIVNTSFAVIRPKEFSQAVLYFILRNQTIKELLNAKAKGTAVPTVKIKDLKEIEIPLEHLNEDNIDKSEKMFYQWVENNRSVRTVKDIVEDQFIENEIISGSYTEQQKSNIIIFPYENLKNRLDVACYMDKQSQDWLVPVHSLSDIAKDFRSGIAIPAKEYKVEGLAYVRIKDMDKNKISHEELVYVDKHFKDKSPSSNLTLNDVLISRVGTIGKAALVDRSMDGSIVNQHITIVRTDEKIIIPEYLVYYLNTRWALEQFEQRSGGSAQRFIKLGDIKEIKVPLPSINIQEEIVKRVNFEMKQNDNSSLEQEINTLIKSILV
ncbi:restriction endonuclease subunit S [Oceanobacillus profundus]|nr:restriction endonuclease subunit S [Oceanobacillus profundus]